MSDRTRWAGIVRDPVHGPLPGLLFVLTAVTGVIDAVSLLTLGRLFVANANGHLFAVSQRCPHLGCRVPFCESSGRFECPCHGSKFDLSGRVFKDVPAPLNLKVPPYRFINEGLLQVGVDAEVS